MKIFQEWPKGTKIVVKLAIFLLISGGALLSALTFCNQWIQDNIPYVSLLIISIVTLFALIVIVPILKNRYYEITQLKQTIGDLQSKEFGLAYSIYWDIDKNPRCPFCAHKPPIRAKHKGDREFLYCHSCNKPVYGKKWHTNINMGYKELKKKIDQVDFSTFPHLKEV